MAAKCSWEGSDAPKQFIEFLRLRRMLPSVERVEARVVGGETTRQPRAGKVVVVTEHFSRGFGLPASTFFRRFLDHFRLQPHHLGPSLILQLAAFITFCEGYAGLEPSVDIWNRCFSLKPHTTPTPEGPVMTACGAALVIVPQQGAFPSYCCMKR